MTFKINGKSHFYMELDNGWTVSLRVGFMDCAGGWASTLADGEKMLEEGYGEAKFAEIACIPTADDDQNFSWYNFDGTDSDTDVKGGVSVTEFLEWLDVFRQLPNPRDYSNYRNKYKQLQLAEIKARDKEGE